MKPCFVFRSLYTAPKSFHFAGIGTTNAHLLQKTKPIKRVYSREYLENYSKNPNFEADLLIEKKKEFEHQHQQNLLNRISNDHNTSNFITVKQKSNVFSSEFRYIPQSLTTGVPLFSLVQPRKPKMIIQGTRRKVPSKLKKLLSPMRTIIGMHLYDALTLMYSKNRKSWSYVAKTLEQVRKHALHRGFDDTRLYVVEALTGKHRRNSGIRFHGKGRGGEMKHDLSQLKIKLEEKPVEELFKIMYKGKTPPMLAYFFKKKILEKNGGYEDIKSLTWVLTGKGRQQQRLMLKRRVMLSYLENLVIYFFFSRSGRFI